jgi:phage replication-related protein YjqB (UPF0714/DUF867 family)
MGFVEKDAWAVLVVSRFFDGRIELGISELLRRRSHEQTQN